MDVPLHPLSLVVGDSGQLVEVVKGEATWVPVP
jgi:hypothetical protein